MDLVEQGGHRVEAADVTGDVGVGPRGDHDAQLGAALRDHPAVTVAPLSVVRGEAVLVYLDELAALLGREQHRVQIERYVGATDVETGRIVYHRCSDGGAEDIEWMRASSSMPIVSRPVKIGKYLLLDGGISDPVPFRFMEKQGYDRNVCVLTQPAGYRKKPASPAMQLLLCKYPAIARAMAVRHDRYNLQMEQLDERERTGEMLVIRPPESLGIGRIEKDPNELERVYQIGRAAAKDRLSEVRDFLQK